MLVQILVFIVTIIFLIIIIRYLLPKIRKRGQYIPMGREWLDLLLKYPRFSSHQTSYPVDLTFQYAQKTDENLSQLRETFHLETIAGKGSEIDKIINLMVWTFQLTTHANEPEIPAKRDAFTLIHLAKDQKKQINCYMKTIILNEVYLAMGFRSRQTHLLPYANEDQESHFVTSVYSQTLGRWIMMDPDFGTYVTDGFDKRNILGIKEVRQRLIEGERLKTINCGRNIIEKYKIEFDNFILGVDYTWFLSEFIFKIRCPKLSTFGQENISYREYFELIPDNYNEQLLQNPSIQENGKKIFYINSETQFWNE